MRKPPKCPTCGSPLPRFPDPSFKPDVSREILRRLTLLELRVKEQEPTAQDDGPEGGSDV